METLPGVSAPLGFFDPAGFCESPTFTVSEVRASATVRWPVGEAPGTAPRPRPLRPPSAEVRGWQRAGACVRGGRAWSAVGTSDFS